MRTPLLSQLQGWPGWQMNGTTVRYLDLVFFCARIEPKMKKIRKTIRKQGFFDTQAIPEAVKVVEWEK